MVIYVYGLFERLTGPSGPLGIYVYRVIIITIIRITVIITIIIIIPKK